MPAAGACGNEAHAADRHDPEALKPRRIFNGKLFTE